MHTHLTVSDREDLIVALLPITGRTEEELRNWRTCSLRALYLDLQRQERISQIPNKFAAAAAA